jgi:ketosteroid isomerase-like protein
MSRMTEQLPAAVSRLIEATNAGDAAAFVAAFTEDGVVDDWGRRFEGPAEIGRWTEAENTGVHSQFRVQEAGVDGDTVTARLAVSGGGYNGVSTFTFEVVGDRVRSMRITE